MFVLTCEILTTRFDLRNFNKESICIDMHAYIYVQAYLHACVYRPTCMHADILAQKYFRTQTRIYTYLHTHIHMHV